MGRAGGGSRPSHRFASSHSFSGSRPGSSHSFSRSSGRSGGGGAKSDRGRSGSSVFSLGSPIPSGPHRPPMHTPSYMPLPRHTRTTVYRDRTVYVPEAGSGMRLAGSDGQAARFWRNLFFISLAFFVLFFILFAVRGGEPAGTASVVNREKLDLGYGYSPDTLTDELGWILDPGGLNRNLKQFYDDTGIVPYIALLSRPDVTAEGMDAEAAYAKQWYSEHLDHEGYVLLAYFDSGIPEVDGNTHLVIGRQAAVVMDAEAEGVFWNYLDHYWGMDPEDMPEDELFANAFIKTGQRIMDRRAEGADAVKAFFLFLTCATSCVSVFMLLRWFRIRTREKAAETAAILRAGREDLQKDSTVTSPGEEGLLSKYGTKYESE